MFSPVLMAEASSLLEQCRVRRLRLVTAESCTGGLIASLLTDIPGASDVFERGYVTYSNEAKTELLGVDPALLAAHGAVSAPVAAAMAQGALVRSWADLSVAVTGIAGPSGGSEEKPVGLVYLAVGDASGAAATECRFSGDRSQIRLAALGKALELLKEKI